MLKHEFYNAVAEKSGKPLATIMAVHSAMLETYYEDLVSNEETNVHGIGIITAFDCPEKTGLHGEDGTPRIARQGRKYFRMRMSKTLKKAVNFDE